MFEISVESIGYQIISKAEAVIQCSDYSVTALLSRNCLAFHGGLIRVAHLSTSTLSMLLKIILIPYSLHTISGGGDADSIQLKHVVFEMGSELASISPFAVRRFSPIFIFIPQSVGFIGSLAFGSTGSAACVHFKLAHFPVIYSMSLATPPCLMLLGIRKG
jgi:hypothetical protein